MKLFKGFTKDMKCRGFQYAEGETYHEDKAELCQTGFHACENPLDCFGYYSPGDGSIYREVELEDVTEEREEDDTKRVGKTIKIGAELDVAGICKAHFEYVKEHCNPVDWRVGGDNESVAVGDKASASAGNYGSASAGFRGSASAGFRGSASAGESGSASAGFRGSASAGFRGSASAGESGSASAGFRGSASAGFRGSASAGNYGSASAGESGSASAGESGSASAGFRGSASAGESGSASAGESGSAVSRGSASVAANGVAVARGNGVKVKGGLGSVLVIAIEKITNCEIKEWKAAVVDGETIKADTWYTVRGGKFVEVENE